MINFQEFQRQSRKGILVYISLYLYKAIRSSWVLILLIITRRKAMDISLYFKIALFILPAYFIIRSIVTYKNFLFKVTEDRFILKQGFFTKTNLEIPFDKIQNVHLKQNFVQQLIQVTEVGIETAGGAQTEVTIRALSEDKAKSLKKVLLANHKVQTSEMSDEEVEKPKAKKKVIQSLDLLSMAKVSLSENHLKSFYVTLLFVSSTYYQAIDSFNQLDWSTKWIEYVLENKNAFLGNVIIVVISLLAAMLLSVLVSFIRVFLKHFEQKVSMEGTRLEISQGLFNKQNIALRKEKLQTLQVISNPIKNYFGLVSLQFKQASSIRVKSKKTIDILGVKQQEVLAFKNLFIPIEKEEQSTKNSIHPYYRLQVLLRYLLISIGINLFISLRLPSVFFAINGIIIPLFILQAIQKHRKAFYQTNTKYIQIGSGDLWDSKYSYLEWHKMQKISIQETYFQRRRNIATLKILTASGYVTIPCIPKESAWEIYDYFIYKVESSDADWM